MSTLAGEPRERNYRSSCYIEQPIIHAIKTIFDPNIDDVFIYKYNKTMIERWDRNSLDGVDNKMLNRAHQLAAKKLFCSFV